MFSRLQRAWAASADHRTWLVLTAAEYARELVFTVGLALLMAGLALLSTAAALIVPGALLIWLAIPPAARPRKTP